MAPPHHRGYAANGPSRDDMIRKQFDNSARNASRSRMADDMMKSSATEYTDTYEIDRLIDRIEARVIERGVERQEETLFRDYVRTPSPEHYAGEEASVTARVLGTLEGITERILRQSRDVREIGVKLHCHADAVHGAVPIDDRINHDDRDRPGSAIARIHEALDDMENSLGYMAEGAGRNTTLV